MLLKDFVTIVLIVGLVAWCISGAVYLLDRTYNGTGTNIPLISSVGGDIENLQELVNSSYKTTMGGEISAGGITGVIFNNIGSFFKTVGGILIYPFKWIVGFGESLGIPKTITSVIVALILISFVFAIVAAILRRTP